MFTSSNNNINPFTLISSCYDPSLYVTDHQNFFFNPAVSVPLSQTSNPLSINTLQNNAVISEQNVGVFINGDDDQQHQQLLQIQKRPVKKLRHRKIRTAQGERDRRVRLSIEISRKFFDLQDMLGFDKASKTLEWLLFKSRKAIKELEKSYEGVLKSFSSNSTTSCENGENIEALVPIKKKDKKMKKIVTNSTTTKKVVVSSTKVVSKETRAKARERARERTRVKMCNRKFHDQSKINQTMVSNYQQNHVINFNNNNNDSANLAQNWDIHSAIMHSNICAITNMNRPTGLQIYGKLW